MICINNIIPRLLSASANISEDYYNIISRRILCIIISNGIFHACLLLDETDLAVLVSFICKHLLSNVRF